MPSQIYRLAEAREMRGFTVAELAEKLEITRQAIYKYEGGTQQPNNEIMEKIVDILGFPLSFFMQPHIGVNLDERPVFFRDMKSSLEKHRRIAKRWLHILVDRVVEYEKYLELPTVNLPHFEINDYKEMRREDIDLFAEQLRRYWRLGDGPISNLTLLLENNGIVITHKDVSSEKLDACSMIFNGRPYILVNTHKQTCSRVLMNLAHELGHLVLHQSIDITEISSGASHKLIEEQAWRFASSFLMPPATFSNEVGYPSLKQFLLLKKRWRVSVAAMIMYCRGLEIINDEKKSYFFRELSRNGWRKNEPLDDKLEIEKCGVLFECEKAIVDEGLELKDALHQKSCLSQQDYADLIAAPDGYFTPMIKRPKLRIISNSCN